MIHLMALREVVMHSIRREVPGPVRMKRIRKLLKWGEKHPKVARVVVARTGPRCGTVYVTVLLRTRKPPASVIRRLTNLQAA